MTVKIFIVEDNKRDSAAFTKIANQYGTSISVDSFHAFRETLETKTNWDLLILDLTLPGTDATNTIDAVDLMRLTMPVIVVTGNDDPMLKRRCESLGWTWVDKNSDRLDASLHYAIRSSVTVDESGESFRVQPSNSNQLGAIRAMLEDTQRETREMAKQITEMAETLEDVLTRMFGKKNKVGGRDGGGCADVCKQTKSIFDAGKVYVWAVLMGTTGSWALLIWWLLGRLTQ
jgi:DNA-binding NtrC family response regulator